MSASSGTVSDTHNNNTVQLCWSTEIKWGWYSMGITRSHTHLLVQFGWAARISGTRVLLQVQKMLKFNFWLFPAFLHCLHGFRIVPFVLIPYLAFALQVFMFSGNTKGHSSAKVVGMDRFRSAPEAFRNGLRRSAFSHLPNAYGDIYILHFSFSVQKERSFCTCGQKAGSWGEALDRAPGRPTEHAAGASPGAGGLSLLACLPQWKEKEESEVWDWK